jgi:hypothetical protein
MLAMTWEQTNYGIVGEGHVSVMRESVGDTVDHFLNDFLAANPSKK